MINKNLNEKKVNEELYRDRDELNRKMEQLITQFNQKWMNRVYISCENPLNANEYPLSVKLNPVNPSFRS
ncbi:MAG: hypothetical protein ACXVC6_00860 [Bacteroidia bacterium]